MDLKESLNQLKILHGSLLAGILIFTALCIMIHYFAFESNPFEGVLPGEALYLIVLVAAASLYGSGMLYKRNLSAVSQLSLKDKLSRYRSAVLLRAALIDVAAMVICTGYLLTGSIIYLMILIVPVAWFAGTFPKDETMAEELNLSYSEQQQLGMQ